MPNNAYSKTEGAAFIPEIWANEGLSALENSLHMARISSRNWQDEFKRAGDTVNVRKPLTFTAADKAAGEDLTYQAPTATTTPIVLNKYKVVPIAAEDVALTESQPELMGQIVRDALVAIAQIIDADGITAAASFTGTAQGTQGTAMDVAQILETRKILVDAKMPIQDVANFVVGSQTDVDLQSISLFQQANTSGGTSVIEGASLGRKFNFDFYVSQNISRAGATAGDKNLAFHPSALTLAMRPLMTPTSGLGVVSATADKDGLGVRVTRSWDAKAQAEVVVFSVLYGWKAVRPELGVVSYGA